MAVSRAADKSYPGQVLLAPASLLIFAVFLVRFILIAKEKSLVAKVPSGWLRLFVAYIPLELVAVVVALFLAARLEKIGWRDLVGRMGILVSNRFAMVVAAGVAILGLLLAILHPMLAGARLRVHEDSLFVLVWMVTCMSIPDTAVFQATVFRILRKGRPLLTAALLAGVVNAAANIPMALVTLRNTDRMAWWGFVFFLVAPVLWSIPLSLMFDRGGRAFWATVVVNLGASAGRLVQGAAIPDTTPNWWFRNGWMITSLLYPLLFAGFIWMVMGPRRETAAPERGVEAKGSLKQ